MGAQTSVPGHGRKPDAQLCGSSITFLQSPQFDSLGAVTGLLYQPHLLSFPPYTPNGSHTELLTNVHSVRTHIPISWRFTQLSLYCLATHNEPQMLVFMGFSIAYHLHGCHRAPCSRRSHFLITSCTLMDGQVSALPPFCAFRS